MAGRGRWKPGESGNPAGRKPGTKIKRTILREQIEACGPELVSIIKTAALNPEDKDHMTAALALLARLEAPLRPAARAVEFEFDPDAAPGENANRVMASVAAGEIDPDTGNKLLTMLAATVGIADIETFAQELYRMREQRSRHVAGGVMEVGTLPVTTPVPTTTAQPAMAKKPWEK
jgi:hypothetical protein